MTFYTSTVRSVVTYGYATWPLSESDDNQLRRVDNVLKELEYVENISVSYTHLDVYKRQPFTKNTSP